MDISLKNTQTKTVILWGAGLAGMTITLLTFLPRDYAHDVLAVLLTLIA
jgi:hypothetical protein